MNPLVYVVLVNYNGEKFQNDCIESLKCMEYRHYKIVVVDNDSKDNSISLLKRKYPEVVVIENEENYGVAKGNNIGIKYSIENGAEYVLLLNNDTVVDEYLLSSMMKNANENTLVAAKTYYYEPSNLLWYAGGKMDWNKAKSIHLGFKETDNIENNSEKYVEYSPTSCLLVHKSVFKKVGYMDEKYFMYYDDTDFCVRVIRGGFKILYNPRAMLWHKVSSSSGGDNSPLYIYYSNRNRLYFIDKFCKNKLRVKIFYYVTRIIQVFRYVIKNKKLHYKMIIEAIRDYHNSKMGFKSM